MENKIPKNLEEALTWLYRDLDDESLSTVKNMKDEDELTGSLHRTWGQAIRNEWGLWDKESSLHKYFKKLGINHADDMSGIIMTTFWRKLNNKPSELDKQIEFYKQYWKNTRKEKPIKIEHILKGKS
jgi:hypothetical protein